ncbi:MAG: N-acetylmuramoyl-L-alanine amidase [Gemmatimonadota bacterium]|nr:N-acetylmuramoyl-L-alanine amidase [Gemmatimonadota bacterium]
MPRPLRFAVILLAACHPAASGVGAAPSPAGAAPAAPSPLPPVPLVEGPLALRVVYPPAGAKINARDSNFVFGSVGNGRAALTINGTEVTVLPNGSFLAWLPVPDASTSAYHLVAALGGDTVRATHAVKVARFRVDLATGTLPLADSTTIAPRGALMLRDDEMVRISVRAASNATVWVRLDSGDRVQPLVHDDRGGRSDPERWSTDVPARLLRSRPELIVGRDRDTVRFALTPVQSPGTLASWSLLGSDSSAGDSDRAIPARPTPTAPPDAAYGWLLLRGTQLEVTGRSGDLMRVRLDPTLEAWVSAGELHALPSGTAAPRRVTGPAMLVSAPDWVDFIVPIGARPAFLVEEAPGQISLTLYGTRSNTNVIHHPANESLVRAVTWEQVTSDRMRFTLSLDHDPFGYLVLWRDGALVLRVRRRPVVDPSAPMRGRRIAIDAGHPPGGATGPTGLWEPVATLAVAQRIRDILTARGATVIMTRTTDAPMSLEERPAIAQRADAEALVSIHLNALPDGVNPFTAHGTGAYYFHPQAIPLARALQNAMVASMGLRDLGINYQNFALARPTWMPSVLCEGAFVMIPEQESALRTAVFQDAYARGVANGIEAYFRSLGTAR